MLQIQEKTRKEFADLKHHIGTIQSSQLNDDELNLLYERLKYQVNILNSQVINTSTIKTDNSKQEQRVIIHKTRPKQAQSVALPKIHKPSSQQQSTMKQPKRQVGQLKQAHLYKASVLNKELRLNPFADPPAIDDSQLDRGVYNLIVGGVIPKDVNINAAFKRGGELIQTNPVQLHADKTKYYTSRQEDFTKYKLAPTEKGNYNSNSQSFKELSPQRLSQYNTKQGTNDIPAVRYLIEIRNNHFKMDLVYMNKYLHIWGAIQHIIKKLENIASGQLDGDQVAKLAMTQFKPSTIDLYACYISKPLMDRLYIIHKKQFSPATALIKVQATVKMFIASRKYQHQRKIVQKVIRIQKEFRLKQMYLSTIKQIKEKIGVQISTLHNRQQQFKLEDFSQNKIEIHLPSYSISQFQRQSMNNFRNRENLQLGRLFRLRDPRLTIIYVTLVLPEEVITYFQKVLEIAGINAHNRIHFIYPENANKFPNHFSLAQLLYFSPQALHKIRQLIVGKFSYIVPSRVGREEFLIAESLQTNILSGPFDKVKEYSSKSKSKDLFDSLNFPVGPGCCDITSKEDFVNKLSVLIYKNLNVARWMFKVNSEFNGRGSAWFSLDGVKQFIEMRKSATIDFEALRELVQALLPIKTMLAQPLMYTFDEYMDYMISNGGIIEAYPTNTGKISTVNIYFEIEPNGGYQLLNTSNSIVMKDITSIGATFPQQGLNINADSMLAPLSAALYREGLFGYVTLQLLTFNGLFYAKSLKFGMDTYISSICLAQSMDCEAYSYIPFLYHPGIGEQRYTDLFAKCRKEGISFDVEKRLGSLILMSDSMEKGIVSLLCLGAPRKSIKLCTDALNFLLHFGGSIIKSNGGQKQDTYYFIDIVNRIRVINSELQQ